jgi:predicted nucleotidyltransferase
MGTNRGKMAQATKEDLLQLITEHQKEITQFGVKRCGLFGSYVRNQSTPQSDIDVLVEFEQGKKSFDNFMRLASFLEDLFGRRVDLVTVGSLSPYIGPRILEEVEYAALSA